MVKLLKKTFLETISHFRSTRNSLFFFYLISIIGAWNGIQFLSFPSHFNAFISESTISIFFTDLSNNYSSFIPSAVFILLTMVLFYWFLHIGAEIKMIDHFKKELTKKEKWILFFNFSVPSFFTHLFVLFLAVTLILLSLIVYLFLISFGMNISFKILLLFLKFFKSAIYIVIFTSFIMNDFVLYFQYKGESFISALKKTWQMIENNLSAFLFYLLTKYLSVFISIFLLMLLVKIYIFPINHVALINALYQKVYILKMMTHWHDVLFNIGRILFASLLSLLFYGITITFLYPFNRLMVWNLFNFDDAVKSSEIPETEEEISPVKDLDSDTEVTDDHLLL
ncbi:MAG TPA: hypothetical protein PKJ08_07460 [Candidatus Cloacimonadota bacterium]|jgi:hypothetical protein|nr:hypothetical protein [Candidatus Cloacimonadota bacterium]